MKKPLLIDLDGVLRIGNQLANHTKKFLEFIVDSQIPACILSNSTLFTSLEIKNFFREEAIEYNIPIITTSDAALIYAKEKYKKVSVYCKENVKLLFNDIIDDDNPEAVIIGDMGQMWNFKILNEIFHKVVNGAELIALQINKYWKNENGELLLDVGPFIKAIEYATDKRATLIGKPSPLYFQLALKALGATVKDSFVMLGDDIDSDIAGAKKLDAITILIYTGKTRKPLAKNVSVLPDYEADDLINVIDVLKKIM
ncbi:HAD-IIA family hydrolase [Melioribacteraceae bacterium 4301-Me]|uniref:HAD-IIA family hydrolase n=1 Tax=Pyranulibacter aquaticus TaxID=3163344 RepID=UPI0035977E8E